jgi:3-phosphoshikimate 1-carboxyvinyltransferase
MLKITPGHAVCGTIGPGQRHALPGDKSLSHRAALFAALAEGQSRIENFLVSGVTEAMLESLKRLGVAWRLEGTRLEVQGVGLKGLNEPAAPLNCGNSATTLRLLTGGLAASGTGAVLDGSQGLRKRPMGRIVSPLQQMGVAIQASPAGTAPLTLATRPAQERLRALDYSLPVASAQVKSALLLAGLSAEGASTLREPGPSRDHSERMLRAMGAEVESWQEAGSAAPYCTRICALNDRKLSPISMRLPGDISSAAFLIVAALITPGSEIKIEGVGLNPTRTGLIEALQRMGADLQVHPGPEQGGEPCGDLTARYSSLQGIEISGDLVVRMIDEFPALAVAAAYASGRTTVRQAEELRYKESDRISVLCGELRKQGVEVQETPDGFVLEGRETLRGGQVEAHGDHRLAMAMAVAGLAAQGEVEVLGAEVINESFPEFLPILMALTSPNLPDENIH